MSHHQNEVDAQLELEDKNEAVEFSLTDVIAEETNIENLLKTLDAHELANVVYNGDMYHMAKLRRVRQLYLSP